MKQIIQTVKYYAIQVYHKFERHYLWNQASAIAFNIIISIIPFILLSLTVLGIYISQSDIIARLIIYINELLPIQNELKEKFIYTMIERANELTSHTFWTAVIGFIALIWTMSSLFSSIRDAFNSIFETEGYKNYFIGKFRDLLLVIVTITLFLISVSLTTVFQLLSELSQNFLRLEILRNLTGLQRYVPQVSAFFTTYIMFFVLYRFVPNFRLPGKVLVYITLLNAILFEIMKYGYTFYVLEISSLSKIYGTYAFIVITIFMIYYISLITVFSATLGKIFMDRNKLKIIT
ncbi:MAG: YihY/virulence factor BrkB family protein [Ignavibacteria bacterium]